MTNAVRSKTNWEFWFSWIVYGLALVTLILAASFPVVARKVFYFTCGLAGIGWCFDRKRPENPVLFLLTILATFALYRITHTLVEAGTFRPRIDAWQVYLATANRLLMGLFLIGYLATRRPFPPAVLLWTLVIALLLSLGTMGWIEYVLQQDRMARTQRATLFSYEVAAVYFAYLGMQLVRSEGNRRQWALLAVVSVIAFWVVLWTGTRSALFGFILGGILLLILSERVRKWRVFGSAMLLLSITLGLCYADWVKPRLMEAQSDIAQYVSGENRATSIGTRFELWRASTKVLAQAPLWGAGYQQRKAIIENAVAQGKLDPVVSDYSGINMHNELLEELSLRGVLGGLLLLMLYSTLVWLAVHRSPKNLALLGLVFAYFFFGVADVLFFSREAVVLFIVLMAVLLAQPMLPKRMPA